MPEIRKKYDREFRDGAVRIVEETGKSIAAVARDLGVNEGTLGNWVARAREAQNGTEGRSGVPSPTGQPGRRREGASSADDTGAGRSRRSSPRPGKPVTWPRAAARPQPKDWQARRSPVNTGAPSPSPVNLAEAKGRVRGIQTKRHRWATADAGRRFDDLVNLVTDPAFLAVAGERVATNR